MGNKNKWAIENEAQLEEHIISTDYDFSNENNYINFSLSTLSADNAPDAQLEEQRSNKSYLHRYLGSIPSWGGSVYSNETCRLNYNLFMLKVNTLILKKIIQIVRKMGIIYIEVLIK
ncbi:MAG: hypothetical protein AABX11_07125 [Nanoarchaeota archaeon]